MRSTSDIGAKLIVCCICEMMTGAPAVKPRERGENVFNSDTPGIPLRNSIETLRLVLAPQGEQSFAIPKQVVSCQENGTVPVFQNGS